MTDPERSMADYEEHFDGGPEPAGAKRTVDYKKLYLEAVDAATPILQAGGRYAHLVQWGRDILKDGVLALAKALDEKQEQLSFEKRKWAPAGRRAHRLYLSRLRRLLNDFEATVRRHERCGGEDPDSMEKASEAYDRAKTALERKLLLSKGKRTS